MTELDDILARIEQREPVVRAWAGRHGDDALRAAWNDAPPGPLHQITVGVKDIIDTADLPTECGSPILAGRRPDHDAACVSLARAAGAVVVGKTVTTEFAMLKPGPTTNPHRASHTPGGSSSGSAAAVADGMVRVAFGTQTAGSVIRPASFCGIYALKATKDLVPMAGVHPFSASLDTLGWYGRTIDDLAAMLTALAPIGTTAPPLIRPPRIGLYRSHQWASASLAAQAAVLAAADGLADAGARIEELAPEPTYESLATAQNTIMLAEGSRAMASIRRRFGQQLSTPLREWLTTGDAITATELARAQRAAAIGRIRHDGLLSGCDALLTPAAPGEAPETLARTGDPVFNKVWTLLGAPCLAIPAARGERGLPIGVQLVGRSWADAELLAVGRWVSEALGVTVEAPPT